MFCTHFSHDPTTYSCQRSTKTEEPFETQPSCWALRRGQAAAASRRPRPKARCGWNFGSPEGLACLQQIRTRSDGLHHRRRRSPGGDPTRPAAKPCIDVLVSTLGGAADQIREMAAQSCRERWWGLIKLQRLVRGAVSWRRNASWARAGWGRAGWGRAAWAGRLGTAIISGTREARGAREQGGKGQEWDGDGKESLLGP